MVHDRRKCSRYVLVDHALMIGQVVTVSPVSGNSLFTLH